MRKGESEQTEGEGGSGIRVAGSGRSVRAVPIRGHSQFIHGPSTAVAMASVL
jgi:hypothetical protein